ncbi:MAG: hypothetical protein NNA23_03550 [Nitrospira sp.]|nr:hypothetical protein [Nitrospira sp.]MCP9463391.1 hypothetical protein [Nitrospira sp.]
MLDRTLWKSWEPKAVFPLFTEARTWIDFIAQDSVRCQSVKEFVRPIYYLWQRKKSLPQVIRDYISTVFRKPMRLRGIALDRKGHYIGQWQLGEIRHPGDFISVEINRLAENEGMKLGDGVFILLASWGQNDMWSSSPGSATVRYVGDGFIGGYRTGLFARPLNPIHGKKHFGFTGLNPQIVIDDRLVASILLINHSSDPEYDRIVTPTIRLYRSPQEYLEEKFGEIHPHGALERSMTDLFPEAEQFLASTGGKGFTVAQAKGVSLASLHILRARGGISVGIDHSRPAFTNVIDYLG